ncbi:hypothetical protein HCB45_07035 [Listeria sp. FSL L7-0091]|uniref:hypothetical protein n=1 Tax=Listeria farberi TaxID=2713500 RepID=UPI0016247295|nr:hypothetical protein [Listeria farberi]MBC2261346.1 hypothetical protein [Listeria farberi]MBC2268679.1 hypothetical protein [Listeria farberi]
MKKFILIESILFLVIFSVLLVQATEMSIQMLIGVLLMTVVINGFILFIAWIIKVIRAGIQSTR